jgi:two-component system, chemotaxis family, chemotaxis protein CheY
LFNHQQLAVMHRHAVLLVEDHADVRDGLAALLGIEGLDVEAVAGAEAALARLHEGYSCCVILLDWHMPIMSGEAFRRAQMADPRLARIPVIVLSADRGATQLAQELGIREILLKPMAGASVLAAIERHCSR